ncbi:enoyl-CoA delta isomerase 1, mitochondrial-like [Lytechinus variegatus]|uniref:enoyl-CoA delta isomerase 1, mitochondrial-like n=1 Tax=Lytechinus variegatus TaxID=7654 RepID=UPI001BB107F3|nr:enoyl-CoA delta isomerase 1, mitochondrial-like [Lytechinus variegatus]
MSFLTRLIRPCVHQAQRSLVASQLPRHSVPVSQTLSRLYSSDDGLVKVEKDKGYAVLSMNRAPVNSLNTEFLQELKAAIDELEEDHHMQGLIITSACPKIFSAGLDITEMYQAPPESTDRFWRSLQDFWLTLYNSRLATVAAVTGHSPAGGCAIAMSCDHRIMADGPFTMGLNEVHLGIVAPFWFKDTMQNTIGQRETERALGLGLLYKPDEALRVGLVDEVVPLENVVDRAREEIQKWIKIPGIARMASKRMIREHTLTKLLDTREADIDMFTSFIQTAPVQKHLGRYLENLKKK